MYRYGLGSNKLQHDIYFNNMLSLDYQERNGSTLVYKCTHMYFGIYIFRYVQWSANHVDFSRKVIAMIGLISRST